MEPSWRSRVERNGLRVGTDLFLVFSPEREDPGNPNFTTRTIPKVLGGSTPACTRVAQALYGQVIDQVVTLSSTRAAEMTKLLENIHRAVNIGLVNELKIVCDRMDIDIHEVIRAAATKPFGFTPTATDCVLLATDHDRFDYDLIKRHAPLIVDTRGRYQEPAEHIVKA